jgi:hypothetical protein
MRNPNAVIGSGSGLGGGAIVIYLLSLFGVHVDSYAAAAIAAALTGAVLWVGRVEKSGGISGLWNRLFHGATPAPPAPKS